MSSYNKYKNPICGIYSITNIVNNKIYVGRTLCIQGRLKAHLSQLKRGKHHNEHLQNSFNQYGEEAFLFETLVECEEQFLLSEEHYWCMILDTHNGERGYNILKTHPHIAISEIPKNRKMYFGYNDKHYQYARKPVLQYDLNGNFVKEWTSSFEMVGEMRGDLDKLRRHLKSGDTRHKRHKGFIFMYKDEYTGNIFDHIYFNVDRMVFQYNKDGVFIKVWDSVRKAGRSVKTDPLRISKNCKARQLVLIKNYYWSYKYLTPQEINERKDVNL